MASPDKKKPRIENSVPRGDLKLPYPLHHSLYDQLQTLSSDYSKSAPFQHGHIPNSFLEEGVLENVRNEIIQNVKANFKESDLFRVYQSIDLGNLPPVSNDDTDSAAFSDEMLSLASKMPTLMSLKAALFSQEFRFFVEKLCGISPGSLTNEVDCAANCHDTGCHLLCHDDVIGTRKVSFILYLTDPEWTDSDGGMLELYESSEGEKPAAGEKNEIACGAVPAPIPVKTIPPTFNSFVWFVVKPGESFHSVQQVFGNKPRLSLQGTQKDNSIFSPSNSVQFDEFKFSTKMLGLPTSINCIYRKDGFIPTAFQNILKTQRCSV
uniref:Prolyl 4-hydroxylase alpha subunit domain-containing protein n=1 Tax=Corethron hystrix TaxID=216773 RepID=A0A7S1BNJ9_9STRA|mmetsp:Transcript_33563/g.77412  ORF Transcript_33563/g.77412 Transcript_33563/m.77412 type:complete len:322 (+) Transcript_33563:62-1027(+)